MARNTMQLDTSGFDRMIRELEQLGGNVERAVTEALQSAADRVHDDTVAALDKANLPAQGRYSKGTTRKSVVEDPRVTWNGTVASVPIGFDFSKPGAGGYLITGTPRMRPDPELHRMYKQKKYMQEIQSRMADVIYSHIGEAMSK